MRDESVQHLKTVLLLGVVVNHAWAAAQYVTTPQIPSRDIVSWFSNVLIISGLPVFFFLSGFFAGKHGDEYLTWGGYGRLILSKLRSLALPYLAWNLLFIVFYLSVGRIVPRIGQRVAMFHLDSFCGFCDKLLGLTGRPIDAPLWFVRDLFLIFCATPLLVWLLKRARWLLVVLGVYLMVVPGFVYQNWYSVVCFALGFYAAEMKFDLHRLERCRWFVIPVWFLGSICVYAALVHYHLRRLDPRILIWFYLISVAAWLGMLRWTNFSPRSFFARFLTPASFFIYASHFLFCSIALHTIAPKIPDAPYKLLILYGVFIGLGGSIILFIFMMGKRFSPKVLSVFSGGRMS